MPRSTDTSGNSPDDDTQQAVEGQPSNEGTTSHIFGKFGGYGGENTTISPHNSSGDGVAPPPPSDGTGSTTTILER